MVDSFDHWPSSFVDLKRELVQGVSQERISLSWHDLLAELAKRTEEIAREGSDFIPQVNFEDLDKLTPEEINGIKQKGCIVIRGVVDAELASGWKTELEDFIKDNTDVQGYPPEDIQMFFLYWTRPQVQARAHPNVLKASAWLNQNLYHVKSGKTLDGADLSVPLTYADRFRMRKPGQIVRFIPPHIDGASIERWEDENFRRHHKDILAGNWRQHDPYEFEWVVNARTVLHNQPYRSSVLRTFQGWISMSETGPTEGTLQVFPDLMLSNSYIILRPFFRPTVPEDSPNILDHKNWKFDISTPDFPGILAPKGGQFGGPFPNPVAHPHLCLEKTMISVPKVNPGDMVFWHRDVIHSVEQQHTGTTDSAVMYIAAVPKTPANSNYIAKQAETFLKGEDPSDHLTGLEMVYFAGLATESDIKEPMARVAMGLEVA